MLPLLLPVLLLRALPVLLSFGAGGSRPAGSDAAAASPCAFAPSSPRAPLLRRRRFASCRLRCCRCFSLCFCSELSPCSSPSAPEVRVLPAPMLPLLLPVLLLRALPVLLSFGA